VSTPLVDIDEITPDESLLAEVRKTRITTPATRVLLVLIVLSAGFLGGALVDRWQRPASSSASNVQSLISQFRRARGGTGGSDTSTTGANGASDANGASGGGGAALFGGLGGATVGTVKLVDGKNVYVQDASGNVIKVTTDPSTQVTISKTGTVGQLAPGSTVIVQGKASSDGSSMAATSISPSGGFGGAGRFPGGAGG
jgi:hypothetical protein